MLSRPSVGRTCVTKSSSNDKFTLGGNESDFHRCKREEGKRKCKLCGGVRGKHKRVVLALIHEM